MKSKIIVVAGLVLSLVKPLWAGVPTGMITYALEDAAFQVSSRLNADKKVSASVKRIAFVKMWCKEGKASLGREGDESIVFETALAATPGSLQFVVHGSREADWTLINEIFDSATDFNWDPKSCPKLKLLKMCDALLTAHLVGLVKDDDANALLVRLAVRLIRVETAEEIWGGVIEGKYSDGGPDNEKVSPNWRKAIEACARDAVSQLPASLDGYGVLMLPIEGTTGRAMSQVFLNALTASGRQEKIRIYDLPNGNASDRMVARFLRERIGAGAVVGDSVLNNVVAKSAPGTNGKLAIFSGMVSVVNENPKAELDSRGLPVDFIGGAVSDAAEARKSYEITTDFKFRDVNDHFRVIASIGATGSYAPPPPPPPAPKSLMDKLLELMEQRGFIVLSTFVIGIVFAIGVLFAIVRLIKGMSRPR